MQSFLLSRLVGRQGSQTIPQYISLKDYLTAKEARKKEIMQGGQSESATHSETYHRSSSTFQNENLRNSEGITLEINIGNTFGDTSNTKPEASRFDTNTII